MVPNFRFPSFRYKKGNFSGRKELAIMRVHCIQSPNSKFWASYVFDNVVKIKSISLDNFPKIAKMLQISILGGFIALEVMWLKTSFNIVEDRFNFFLNFDVCVV